MVLLLVRAFPPHQPSCLCTTEALKAYFDVTYYRNVALYPSLASKIAQELRRVKIELRMQLYSQYHFGRPEW